MTPRRAIGKRIWLLLPTGCLLLVGALLVSTLLTFRAMQPGDGAAGARELSWKTQFGSLTPSVEPPESVAVAPALGTFVFPELLSVEDAVEWNGGWLILDARGSHLYFLDFESGVLETLAGEGAGPGELQDPMAMALSGRDSLLGVLNERGFFLDLFDLHSGFVERRRIEGGGCVAGLARRLVAAPSGALYLLRICPAVVPGPGTAWVEAISRQGRLTPVVAMSLGEAGSRRLYIERQPILLAGREELYLGTWDAPCLRSVMANGTPSGTRCLPTYTRPPTSPTEESSVEARLRKITELGLLPIDVPETLPWLDEAFTTPLGPVVRRIRGEEERDLVLLRSDERASVAAHLFPSHTFIGELSILAAADLIEGTQVQVFPNPWR